MTDDELVLFKIDNEYMVNQTALELPFDSNDLPPSGFGQRDVDTIKVDEIVEDVSKSPKMPLDRLISINFNLTIATGKSRVVHLRPPTWMAGSEKGQADLRSGPNAQVHTMLMYSLLQYSKLIASIS